MRLLCAVSLHFIIFSDGLLFIDNLLGNEMLMRTTKSKNEQTHCDRSVLISRVTSCSCVAEILTGLPDREYRHFCITL
ncbi:hypothetical protein BC940DRAFT_289364 [Gongronella butleri]|nr:hypothetical protein BC940DRAFT_289364 [Gongronella butleri]